MEFTSIHIIKQSPPPRLYVSLSAHEKLENYCTDFHAVFTNRYSDSSGKFWCLLCQGFV